MSKKVVVLTAALLALTFLFSACGDSVFNYEGDMSPYVTLPDDLLNASIVVERVKVPDALDVNAQIGANATGAWKYEDAAYEPVKESESESDTDTATETESGKKETETKENDAYIKDKEIPEHALGYIYYYGITNEDGKPISSASNLDNKTVQPSAIFVAPGSFTYDFAEQLIGTIPNNTSFAKKGEVKADSIVYLTAKTTYTVKENGKDVSKTYADYTFTTNYRVDLGDEDNIIANLFRDKAVESGVAKKFKVENLKITVSDVEYDATAEVTVNYVVNDVAVKYTFPDDYKTAALQGKEATFYVVVDGYLPFEEVAKKLGDDGKEYKAEEGKDLYESYEAKVLADLMDVYEEEKKFNKYNAIWAYLMDKAEIEVPNSVLATYYEEAEENCHYNYEQNCHLYEQLGLKFGKTFTEWMQESYGKDWKKGLHEECETKIKERILLHYLADELNIPDFSDKELASIKEECSEEKLDYDSYTEAILEAKLWDKVMQTLAGDLDSDKIYISVTEQTETESESGSEDESESEFESDSESESESETESTATAE